MTANLGASFAAFDGFRPSPHCAMQYNKQKAIANRLARGTRHHRLPMTVRPVFLMLGLIAPLWLGGCADTAPSDRVLKPFSALMRSDDQTLTKAEQKAAISELQDDKRKQETAAQSGTVVPAKTAQ
ncbi:hypothetical protein [Methyloceanibacter sp.]|uniref:hypothetical protein n=1 Tax=Methyloceanibacter sp. TaxID=1965321 RepID=UPI002D32586C|nr:hypothetical protein [Methyloceanibacter sp.]HZP08937.1 hypothetical protein [Methyloceanibacter sp.]